MRREKNYKTARLIEALEYIDVRFIEEAAEKIKVRPTGQAFYGKPSHSKALRQILALAACVLLLSAAIPAITYLANHLPDIVAFFIGDETTDTDPELTHPETPSPETTVLSPETTEETTEIYHETTEEPWPSTTAPREETSSPPEETTAPPEPEYDGSRGLEYQIEGDHAVLVGIGTCTDKDIAVASTYNGYPVTVIGERALYYENINSIKISDTVEVIEKEALGAGKYVSVYISSSVRQLEGAFSTCDRLEEIIVDAKNPKYKSVNNCLINKETKTLVLGCKNSIIPADESVTVIGTRAFETAMFTEITIPNGIIEIGEEAFAWCMMLESIVIPDSVKIIGDAAFMDCERAKTLKIGKGVESIGQGAFYCCFNITEVELPKDLKTLGGNAFGHCDGLKSIVIPNGVKLLDGGSSLFSSCDSLESVILPEGIEEIGGWFFGGCENLKSITIPSSVKAIGENAFYGCYLLKEIIIPEGVTEIGEGAFEQCKGITKIVIPDSVKTIGKSAFEGCTELVSVVLPSSIDEISTSLFSECSKLKEVNIPEGVTAISSYAFRKCISIEKLILPDSVKTIGEYTFNECSALRDIYLGDGLESICIWAFENCTSLKEIAFPDSLKEIGHHAFVSSGLESVTIPKGITTINEGVFTSCSSLKDVSLPQGLTKLDYRVFTGCTSLETLVIPDTVTTLGGEIFKNCGALTEINYKGTVAQWNALIKEDNWNSGCAATLVHCSNGDVSLNEYDGSRGLEYRIEGDHAVLVGIGTCTDKDIVIASTYNGVPVVIIEDGVFKNNKNIRSVTIPDKVHYIGEDAFAFCTSLESVVLPKNLKTLGADAFNGCTSLVSISIPAGITEIDSYAFSGCSSLKEIAIPEGVTVIGNEAFYLCKNLKSVTLPSTLEYIQDWAFANCESLESIVIPDSVKWIGQRAFSDCAKLSSVTLGQGLEQIQGSAFHNCAALKSVKFPRGLKLIEAGAFSGCTSLADIAYAGTVSEWNFVDSTGEGYYYQSFTWHKDVPAQKIRCSDGEAMLDSPSAGRYRAVLNNEAKFILDSKEIFLDEFCFPYSGLSITACDDVKYAIIDMDRNGENEVVITGANGDMLVLHDENGKFYGFDFSFRNMDRIKTDGSFEWNDMTADGLSYGDARLSFDSDKCQKKNICHVTGDGTDNVQFFVDGNPTTREDYLNAYASISKTEVTWYPIERYPIN